MMIRNKAVFWLAASMVFVAGVSATPFAGDMGRNGTAAPEDSTETAADTAATAADTAVAKTAKADEPNPSSIIDEVVWVVGDEPILLSEVEEARMMSEQEGFNFDGRDPDCAIPEQLALQKLFLHQAAIDSIEVSESEVAQGVERQINSWLQSVGGDKAKLEEYKGMSLSAMRSSLQDDYRNRMLIEREREKLVADITVSPADVRRYFSELPADSLPVIPTEVEVEIIVRKPRVEQAEIDRVKNELRDYTDRVTRGETSFAALARLYSEDPGTARNGGEFEDYVGRGMLDPAFANVAFNLTDPKKISKIVETDFGYHIIQLVDKRGDKIKVRHILRKPVISKDAIEKATARLDSIADEIRQGKFTFEQAATYTSDDKDTRNNNGLMANNTENGRTSKFQMRNLPSAVARVVDTLKVDQVSDPFQMINEQNGSLECAIVKLKSRTETHRATITEDFQTMKDIVLAKRRKEFLDDWVRNKIKTTYVKMADRYKNCNFEYQGWIK